MFRTENFDTGIPPFGHWSTTDQKLESMCTAEISKGCRVFQAKLTRCSFKHKIGETATSSRCTEISVLICNNGFNGKDVAFKVKAAEGTNKYDNSYNKVL